MGAGGIQGGQAALYSPENFKQTPNWLDKIPAFATLKLSNSTPSTGGKNAWIE